MATTSTAEMLRLHATPPKESLSSLWQESNASTTMVVITAPVSSIIDISVDYVINDGDALLTGPSISGATAGTIYHKQPDGNASVMGNLNTIA